jgi:PPOX class probable F420-dependent enzyme
VNDTWGFLSDAATLQRIKIPKYLKSHQHWRSGLMSEVSKDLFKGHQYLTIESYRKNGNAVRTPVWFAEEGDLLYVWTSGVSGKARRIRRNPQVKIAPANQSGKPLGDWVSGLATLYAVDTPTYQHGNALMDRKYGLMKKLFNLFGRQNKADRTIITIQIQE